MKMTKGLKIIQAGLREELTIAMSEHNEWIKSFITKQEQLGKEDIATIHAQEMMKKYESYRHELAKLNLKIESIIEEFEQKEVKKMKRIIKALRYQMNYKDFNENNNYYETWESAIWSLYNRKNYGYGKIKSIDVGQRGRDKNGFYQNYVQVITTIDADLDEWLETLGYVFQKDEINLLEYQVEWDENIDEVIAYFDQKDGNENDN